MAQLMPLPLTVSCFSKIQVVLPFWYRLTWVVPDKKPLNGVCVCVLPMAMARSSSAGVVLCYIFPVLWMTSYLHIS